MKPEPEELAGAVLTGKRRALARAITLIESKRPDHRVAAADLLERVAPHTGNSIRIGISGAPGTGKSTFIEVLGNRIIDSGHRVAVLTIDPSSALSGGSILGDKTRMEKLSRRVDAYIRPSPAGRTLGGVTGRTRETLLLCEAAGFNVILVETVGVGQSETAVAEMTDMFLLLLLPGGGDELQGIKRGIVELADLILVNKADGALAGAAQCSAAEYRSALQLIHPRSSNWTVRVETCSALKDKGIDKVWEVIRHYREALTASGELIDRRSAQSLAWMWNETIENLMAELKGDVQVRQRIVELESAVLEGRLPPTIAARKLLDTFMRSDR